MTELIHLDHAKFVINTRLRKAYTIASDVWLDLWEDSHQQVIFDLLTRVASTVHPFHQITLTFLYYTQKIAHLYDQHPSQSVTFKTTTPFDHSLQVICNLHKYIAKHLVSSMLALQLQRPTIVKIKRELSKNGTIDSIRSSVSRHMSHVLNC